MRNLWRDLRCGLRVFAGSPGLAAVAVFTLGLGIASTTTVFSWIDSVLLHPYPAASRSEELAALEMVTAGAPNGGTSISWLDFKDYRDRMHTTAGVAVYRHSAFTVGEGRGARLAWGELVSGNYFRVMAVTPAAGRFFSDEEASDAPGAHPVAVISARLWRGYFRGDPAIAGKTVRINRHTLTVVGVAPPAFRGTSPVLQYEIWVPATMGAVLGSLTGEAFTERGNHIFEAVCRLRPGVSVEQARAEAGALAGTLAAMYPDTNRRVGATVLPTWKQHNGINEYLRAPLTILLAVSFVVLLIVCANVANLLLARSVGRQREFGIRVALGAGRTRIARQVLAETLVLAAAGCALGLLGLLWMRGSLVSMVPSVGYPISTSFILNGRILAFTALTCLAAALVSGASPALLMFHSNPNDALKDGGRGDTAGSAARRVRNLLVVTEVALATIAVVGSSLFMQSFRNARAVNPGFDATRVLLGRFFIESTGYASGQIQQFAMRLKEKLLASAGVEAVSYTDFVPLSSTAGPYSTVRVDGYTPAPGESTDINRAIVSPDYFATMRIPLLEGRDFNTRDDRQSEPVTIVNQAFAARFFGGQSPVGRKVRARGKWWTVVGLARDSKYFSPVEPPSPHFYLPWDQAFENVSQLYVLARTAQNPANAIPLLRRAVTETDANAAAFHPVPLADYTEVATFGQKVAASLLGALGLMCLVLAGSGLYGVMSYSVSQRIAEIGIRIAVGARPWHVIAMVMRQGMALALAGMALGAAASFAAARLVSGLLFRVEPANPGAYLLAAAILAGVTLVATWLPAMRATRVDPMLALRR